MEPKILKSVSDLKSDAGTYGSGNDGGTFGNKFLGERNVRGGSDVADTSAAYGNLPADIVRKGGIDAFEHPSRESTYAKVNDDCCGAATPWKPKGRK